MASISLSLWILISVLFYRERTPEMERKNCYLGNAVGRWRAFSHGGNQSGGSLKNWKWNYSCLTSHQWAYIWKKWNGYIKVPSAGPLLIQPCSQQLRPRIHLSVSHRMLGWSTVEYYIPLKRRHLCNLGNNSWIWSTFKSWEISRHRKLNNMWSYCHVKFRKRRRKEGRKKFLK